MSQENDAPTTMAGHRALMGNMIEDSRKWYGFQFERVLVDIDVTETVGVIVKGQLASNITRRTNTGTSYVFTARVLVGIASVTFGGPAFRDIELSQDIFVSQWATPALNHQNGKILGMQQRLYGDVVGHDDNEDDS